MRGRRRRRGFTLMEVLAAFVIALLLLAPVTAIMGGVAGSFSGVQRSAERRAQLEAASVVAMTLDPLVPGTVEVDGFLITVEDAGEAPPELADTDWALYAVSVATAQTASTPLLQTLRIARR